MEKIKKFFSNIYAVLGAIIAVLFGLFMLQKSKKEDAESKLRNVQTDADSKILDAKKESNDSKLNDLESQAKADKKEAESEDDKALSDWFNKKGK